MFMQGLSEGSLTESECSSGEVASQGGDAAAVAVRAAANHMSDADSVPAAVVMQYLPWLLQQSDEHSLQVLMCRDLPIREVISILQGAWVGCCESANSVWRLFRADGTSFYITSIVVSPLSFLADCGGKVYVSIS